MQNTQRLQSGFFRRMLGFMIDLIFLNIVWLVFGGKSFSLSINWVYEKGKLITTVVKQDPINGLYFLCFLILYFIITESIWGKTLGKLITNQKVVDINKVKPSFGKIVVKNIFKIVDLIIGSIVFLLSSKNQNVGNMATQTYVVNIKSLDKPIEARSVSTVRKIFGILFILVLIGMIFMTIISIPKTKQVGDDSIALLKSVQDRVNSGDMNGFYENFIPQIQAQETFEEFEKSMFDSKMDQNMKALQINNIKLNVWKYNDTQRLVQGGDGKSVFQLVTQKQVDGSWKIFGFVIDNPDIKNN